MLSRRRLISNVIAVPPFFLSLSALPAFGKRSNSVDFDASSFDYYIFNNLYSVASDFAKTLDPNQIKIADITNDLTQFWYQELDLQWKVSPMQLVGITSKYELFIIETLARDKGMHVIKQEKMEEVNGLQMVSWLIGPRTALKNKTII